MEHFMLQTQGVKILVVDDSQPNLLIAKGIMTRSGIAVTTATSGAEAIRYAKETEYDLIVLDRMMPGMDGHETALQLRALGGNHSKTPIVLYTSGEEQALLSEYSDVGIEDVLIKPLDIMELSRILLKYLTPGKILDEQEVRRLLNYPDQCLAFTKVQTSSELARALSGISQLEYEAGLRYTGGTDENYLNVIRISCKSMDEARQRLADYAERILLTDRDAGAMEGSSEAEHYDIGGVRIDAHSMSGICASIGLNDFAKTSARLEQLAIEENHIRLREELWGYVNELSGYYESLTKAIAPLLENRIKDEDAEEAITMDAADYAALWKQTEESMTLFDIDAIQEGLHRLYAATAAGEKKDALKRAIEYSESFEYAKLSSLLEQYRED